MRAGTGIVALAMLAAGSASADTKERAPVPSGEPWLSADDYPATAVRNGEEGLVVMMLEIDAAGKVTGCRIDVSSGVEALDRTSCDLTRERARFEPARDARGRAVAATLSQRIDWQLPDDGGLTPLEHVLNEYVTEIDAAGKPVSCTFRVDGRTQGRTECPVDPQAVESEKAESQRVREESGIAGPMRLTFVNRIDHGDTPPAVQFPPMEDGDILLSETIDRFSVDAHGMPSDCRTTTAGIRKTTAAEAEQANPCARKVAFSPVEAKDGTRVATKGLMAVRLTVRALPPAPAPASPSPSPPTPPSPSPTP